MKPLLLVVVFLAACKPQGPEVSAILSELSSVRRDLEEVKKSHSPKLEAVEAMDDLAREVKALRQKIANPPPAPLVLPPLAAGGTPVRSGTLSSATGGSQAGVNDLFWVLGQTQVGGEERTVLCLYRAVQAGKGFQLDGVRMLNADLQIIEWNSNRPSVKEVLGELQKLPK